MRVAREILEHLRRSAEGSLSIDDPIVPHGLIEQALERVRCGEFG